MTSILPSSETTANAGQLLASLLTGDTSTDPYDGYRLLREQAPVFRTGSGTVVLTRFADVEDALRHRDLGRADRPFGLQLARFPRAQVEQTMARWRTAILFNNPPAHTRLRRLVSSAFTPRHIEGMRASVAARVEGYLTLMAGRPVTEFMEMVALPLSVRVIADLLGVPSADHDEFTSTVCDMADLLEPSAGTPSLARALTAEQKLAGYFTSLLADKRRAPGDDLLSRLAASRDADALDDTEMIATALLLFGAGFETTTNLLGNGLYALLTHPGQLAALRRQPGMVHLAVEEFLRFDPPVQFTSRCVMAPCSVAGMELSPTQVVLALIAAANRDPVRFTHPERFDVTRDEGPSLSFSQGLHFCLGAHLARLEAAEFFNRLLHRYPRIELAGTPRRRARRSLRGFTELPVRACG